MASRQISGWLKNKLGKIGEITIKSLPHKLLIDYYSQINEFQWNTAGEPNVFRQIIYGSEVGKLRESWKVVARND